MTHHRTANALRKIPAEKIHNIMSSRVNKAIRISLLCPNRIPVRIEIVVQVREDESSSTSDYAFVPTIQHHARPDIYIKNLPKKK